MKKKSGHDPVSLVYLQRAVVDRDGWADHRKARTLAVINVDAGIVYNDPRTGRALEHDAARRAGPIADHHGVAKPTLQYDVGIGGGAPHPARRGVGGGGPASPRTTKQNPDPPPPHRPH